MMYETIGEKPQDLVQELLTKIGQGHISMEEAEAAVARCVSFLRDKKLLEAIAREIGISLSGFRTTDVMEMYYDVGWKGMDFCSISKGWKDPGFRIGEVITLGADQIERFQQNAVNVLNTCATHGVGCGVQIAEGNKLQLDLSVCLYQEGLSATALKNAFEAFELCMNKVKAFWAG